MPQSPGKTHSPSAKTLNDLFKGEKEKERFNMLKKQLNAQVLPPPAKAENDKDKAIYNKEGIKNKNGTDVKNKGGTQNASSDHGREAAGKQLKQPEHGEALQPPDVSDHEDKHKMEEGKKDQLMPPIVKDKLEPFHKIPSNKAEDGAGTEKGKAVPLVKREKPLEPPNITHG